MKKRHYLLAAAALVLAACSSSDELAVNEPATSTDTAEVPLSFDAYVVRGVTRAGQAGDITTSDLSGTGKSGFGVFAYYTDNYEYSNSYQPNFMYNQQITGTTSGSTTTWSYEPVKYWPNEYGSTAISDDVDKVSFFAYAPWVSVKPETGIVNGTGESTKEGITQLSRNTDTGDPIVKYIVTSDPDKKVDLLWGVAVASTSGAYEPLVSGTTVTAGEPYLNLTKAKTTSKVKFDFKHALAKLKVTVKVDESIGGSSSQKIGQDASSTTHVFIRSITFEGFAMEGALNLNSKYASGSTTPTWLAYNGVNDLTFDAVTFHDGRKDGKEGLQSGGEQSNEKYQSLNPEVIQTFESGTATTGVKSIASSGTAQNLFKGTGGYIYVIPGATETFKVTIVYDVETKDENLATYLSDGKTHGSSIENKISKTIQTGSGTSADNLKLAAGSVYTINLTLGMNSVDFDAQVTVWGTEATASASLPGNE